MQEMWEGGGTEKFRQAEHMAGGFWQQKPWRRPKFGGREVGGVGGAWDDLGHRAGLHIQFPA